MLSTCGASVQHCDALCMYLRNQQLAVAVESSTPSRFTVTNEPQHSIAFNSHHSTAQLCVAIFYMFYPVELICVMLSKMLVIDRISHFLRKVSGCTFVKTLSLLRILFYSLCFAGRVHFRSRANCGFDPKCVDRVCELWLYSSNS